MSKRSIKVTLAGRIYPVSVNAEEEEKVREAAEMVENSVKNMQENFAVKDKQDLLAMTALQKTVALLEAQKAPPAAGSEADLDRLEAIIDSIR